MFPACLQTCVLADVLVNTGREGLPPAASSQVPFLLNRRVYPVYVCTDSAGCSLDVLRQFMDVQRCLICV